MKIDTVIKIESDYWLVREWEFQEEPDKDGDCEIPLKIIRINQNLSHKDKMYRLVHEIAHACSVDVSEEFVFRLEMALRSAKVFG